MTDRLLDFADSPASLSLENSLLVIRLPEQEKQTVPLADIAAVVTSHRQVTFTQSLVAALGKAGAILVCCDERHHPASMLLPLEAHSTQTERFRAQAGAGLPARKRVWQELVRAKIAAQARTLAAIHGEDAGLGALAQRVRSGDAGNLESVAAQRYWPRVFADAAFRRNNEDDPRNALLNYGYAILRAITARAICGAGLHPSFGVQHANRYNAFCLADDLMEPFRPLVDYQAAILCQTWEREQWALNKTSKVTLLSALAARRKTPDGERTLFDIAARRAQALASVLTGKKTGFACEDLDVAP